jgi:DNA invertase Pin-like site-specific DNA recombinase
MMQEATAAEHPFDAILIHSQSRFFRNALKFGIYELQLRKADVALISITQPITNDPSGDVIRTIVAAMDQYQSRESGKHVLRCMKEHARQGYFVGTRPPFGYRVVQTDQVGRSGWKRKLAIDSKESEIVRVIFDLARKGRQGKVLGAFGIARHLNETGQTMRGRSWTANRVHLLHVTVFMSVSTYSTRCGPTNS